MSDYEEAFSGFEILKNDGVKKASNKIDDEMVQKMNKSIRLKVSRSFYDVLYTVDQAKAFEKEIKKGLYDIVFI